MPTNISETDTWTSLVKTPNDGELADRSSLELNFLQALANRTRYIYNSVHYLNTSDTRIVIPLWNVFVDPVTNGWGVNYSTPSGSFTRPILNQQNNIAGGVKCFVPIPYTPYRGRVIFVNVNGQGNGSHGAMPAVRPFLRLVVQDQTGEPFQLHGMTLGPSTLGAYVAKHNTLGAVDSNPINNLSGGLNGLWVELTGEHGSNSLAFGYTIYSISITFGPQS